MQTLERYKQRLDRSPAPCRRAEIETSSPSATSPTSCSASRCARSRTRSVTTSQLGTTAVAELQSRSSPAVSPTISTRHPRLPPRASGEHDLEQAIANLNAIDATGLLDPVAGAKALGFTVGGDALDSSASPLGYRMLSKVPRLPGAIVDRLVDHFGSLQKLLAAGVDDLMGVEGVGEAGRSPRGLSRLAEAASSSATSDRVLTRGLLAPVPLTSPCCTTPPPGMPPTSVRSWRDRGARVGVLLSEVMSQRRDRSGRAVWRTWMHGGRPRDLAESPGVVRAGAARIPATGAALHESAARIVERHAARCPATSRAAGPARDGSYTAPPSRPSRSGIGRLSSTPTSAGSRPASCTGGQQPGPDARRGRSPRHCARGRRRGEHWNAAVMELAPRLHGRAPGVTMSGARSCAWLSPGGRHTRGRSAGQSCWQPTGRCAASSQALRERPSAVTRAALARPTRRCSRPLPRGLVETGWSSRCG